MTIMSKAEEASTVIAVVSASKWPQILAALAGMK